MIASIVTLALAITSPGRGPKFTRPGTKQHSLAAASGDLPPPPPRKTPDKRQAELMERMGYRWDGTSWGKGVRAPPSCRSGNRFARFVDDAGVGATTPATTAGAKRLEQLLQNARDEVMPTSDADTANALRVKGFATSKVAPVVWLSAQVAALAALTSMADGLDWSTQLSLCTPANVALGAVAGATATVCRAAARRSMVGVEEPDGALERLLVDGMEGAHAVPMPAHVRADMEEWALRAFVTESIASVNVAVLLHTVLQAAIIRATSDAFTWRLVDLTSGSHASQYLALIGPAIAAVAVAVPSCARSALYSVPPRDGIPAECAAAERAKRNAYSYFSMCPPEGVDARDAASAMEALADAWCAKFCCHDGVLLTQSSNAFVASLAFALSWQAAGGALIAPIVARAFVALDTYVLRPEPENARVSVPLSAVAPAPPTPEGDEVQVAE